MDTSHEPGGDDASKTRALLSRLSIVHEVLERRHFNYAPIHFGQRDGANDGIMKQLCGDAGSDVRQTNGSHGFVSVYSESELYYAALIRALEGARLAILLESYIFAPDEVGRAIARALFNAAARGVVVRVHLDAVGSHQWLWASTLQQEVPLIRLDNYDKNGGAENIDELTLQLNYFFDENVKGMIEYWDRSGEGTTPDDSRVTVQFYAYF